MAEVVLTLGVPHTPLLWRLMRNEPPADLAPVARWFERFAAMLDRARPDVIVLVATDHFRRFSTANMPAFLIGKAPEMLGTHPNEARQFGLPRRTVPGDPELAGVLLGTRNLPDGFDFAFSDEPWLDHGYMVPLLYLRPGLDIPVVPINTNCNTPPLPGAPRFAELGRYIRTRLHDSPVERRVAIVASGHLAVELGGPRQFSGASPDPEFDREALNWMATGDIESAIAGCSYDRMLSAGNLTFQFLNFITAMTAAGAGAATVAEGIPCRFGSEPFFAWETA